jgi:hypothetical protein
LQASGPWVSEGMDDVLTIVDKKVTFLDNMDIKCKEL